MRGSSTSSSRPRRWPASKPGTTRLGCWRCAGWPWCRGPGAPLPDRAVELAGRAARRARPTAGPRWSRGRRLRPRSPTRPRTSGAAPPPVARSAIWYRRPWRPTSASIGCIVPTIPGGPPDVTDSSLADGNDAQPRRPAATAQASRSAAQAAEEAAQPTPWRPRSRLTEPETRVRAGDRGVASRARRCA